MCSAHPTQIVMGYHINKPLASFAIAVIIALLAIAPARAQRDRIFIPNEQGRIQVRDSGGYAPAPLPRNSVPPTVGSDGELEEWKLSLDEAIRVALKNTDVVRVLSGLGAASSGQTIYSPGIANAAIDQARGVFDPNLSIRNNFLRNDSPSASFDPSDPNRAIVNGTRSNNYSFGFDLTKRFLSGADGAIQAGANRSQLSNLLQPFPLNPQTNSDFSVSLTQPFLRGAGVDVNSVPIVLAFLDTESSYFRLKNSLQNLVAGVIQGYWNLVQARTELWVIQRQVEQTQFLFELETENKAEGRSDQAQLAQTASQLANFKANLIGAEAAILNDVANLKAVLGLPPGSEFTILPTTPPVLDRIEFDWEELVALAEQRRPELVELKIILEADRQRITQAKNRAQPSLDAVALYRWNGLEGTMPVGDRVEARPERFTDWTLGVNFSVPLTLRADRAALRQVELLLANDRANLKQGLLQASHEIASILRSIEQLYAQYKAFGEARKASEDSLEQIFQEFQTGRVNLLEYLLAINTWASSKSAEARAITQLNATFATLEASTGTILETHGVRLLEERYCAIGPLGQLGAGRSYPSALRPSGNAERYEAGEGAAESAFDLTIPVDLTTREDEASDYTDEGDADSERETGSEQPPPKPQPETSSRVRRFPKMPGVDI